MKKYINIITLFTIFIWIISNQGVQATLDLSYNMDIEITQRKKYTLDNDIIKLYIPEFNVKGLYVTGWAAGSSKIMNNLIGLAERTIINTMVIDLKDQDGYLSYISNIPFAKEIGANKKKVKNLKGLIDRLHDKGIYTIGRIAVFKDHLLSQQREELRLKLYNSENGKIISSSSWVDPVAEEVWQYNVLIAKEAVKMGFDEIQFDYVRYPAMGNGSIQAVVPKGRTKSNFINGFTKYAKEQLKALNIPISVDVFGLTTTVKDDLGIGQNFNDISNIINIISPMVYPSHYAEGSYGIEIPELEPDRVIYRSLSDARKKVKDNENIIIRPWLQDFSLQHKYTYKEIIAQIRAAESLGIKEWLLWNPSSKYTEEAIKDRHY